MAKLSKQATTRDINEQNASPQFAHDLKDWMDEKRDAAYGSAYRGGFQVLTSGFGKGMLVAAALITVAAIAGVMLSPATFGFGAMSVGQSVAGGLQVAGNLMLGSVVGIASIVVGGAIGSIVSAHSENNRIGKDAAVAQAVQYEKLRENASGKAAGMEFTPEQEEFCHKVTGGHCAKLLQEHQSHERTV